MLKVLFVDDEIMAMQYLAGMIDWQEEGFEIAAMETSPEKGLQLLKEKVVDVAFVDIRMPGMDGLQFTERALKINSKLKVVILTSYGDFEYARTALHLGVNNYLLKHDVTAGTLQQELKKLKANIKTEEKSDKVLVAETLKRVIEYETEFTDEEKEYINRVLGLKSKHMICFWVEQDIPYPLISNAEQYYMTEQEDSKLEKYIELLNYDELLVLGLDKRKWIVLTAFKPVVSQRQIIEETYAIAYNIQRYVHQNYEKSVSIIPSKVFTGIESFTSICAELKEMARYLIFFERNKVVYEREISMKSRMNYAEVAESLKRTEAAMAEESLGETLQEVDTFFGKCTRNMDPVALENYCRGICNMIETFARKHNLIEYRRDYIEYGKKVYSAAYIHNWIGMQVDNLMKELREKAFRHYSPKVREAIKYIHDHYSQNIKNENIAASIGVSGEYLRHLFKEEVGRGINEYLTELRIEKAKTLLQENKYKLYEIAELVGYQSGAYFSSAFKKHTGVRPQDYKGDGDEEKARD